jgi:hypothetical protein
MKSLLKLKNRRQLLWAFIKTILMAVMLINLTACTENIRGASPEEIEKLIKQEVTPDKSGYVWTAPELQVQHYRMLFYGYNTVNYWLTATKSNLSTTNNTRFRLLIDANYGANPGRQRNYSLAKSGDGVIWPLTNINRETGRCQFFNTLNFACLFRERAEIELSEDILTANQHTGFVLTLESQDTEYEQIDLPAEYINALLRAVHGQ